MRLTSYNAINEEHLTSPDPTRALDIEKRENRRLALVILSIAVGAYLGSIVIGNSEGLIVSYLTPGLFDIF